MKTDRLDRITPRALLRSLSQLRAVTIHPSAPDLLKFKRLAAEQALTVEQYLSALMQEAIEIDEAAGAPQYRRHGNRKPRRYPSLQSPDA